MPYPRARWRSALILSVGLLAAGTWSCGGSTDPSATPVDTVVLSDTAVVLRPGVEAALVARPTRAGGEELAGRRVFWSTRDTNVASVTQAGVIRGRAVGTTEVAASVQGRAAVARVTVLARPIAVVQVAPASFQLVVGGRQRLAAQAFDDAGAPAAATVTWTSLTPATVSVTADGEVAGLAPGVGSVRAAVDGVNATASVVVAPVPVAKVTVEPAAPALLVGATQQLTATASDAGGAALAGRAVAWTSRDPGVAVVSSAGQVTGIAPGTATVDAVVDGVTGSATVRVTDPSPVASVEVAPTTATITEGQTQNFTATARASDGRPVTGRTVTWTTSAPAVATVSPAGVVTAVAAGTAQLSARVDGITGSATITVRRVPVAAVQVAPSPASVAAGATTQLTATPRDAAGNPLGGRDVAWSSSNTAVATVASDGRVTGVAPGSATVRATSEGASGTSAVTVTAVVRVSPEAVTVRDRGAEAGRVARLEAKDHTGRLLGPSEVTWVSLNPLIATVDGNGLVRGISSGSGTATTTVRVTYRGATATAAVTVRRD